MTWNALNQKSVEDLFAKVQVETESIRQVAEYPTYFLFGNKKCRKSRLKGVKDRKNMFSF